MSPKGMLVPYTHSNDHLLTHQELSWGWIFPRGYSPPCSVPWKVNLYGLYWWMSSGIWPNGQITKIAEGEKNRSEYLFPGLPPHWNAGWQWLDPLLKVRPKSGNLSYSPQVLWTPPSPDSLRPRSDKRFPLLLAPKCCTFFSFNPAHLWWAILY